VKFTHAEIQELIQRSLSEPLPPDVLIEVNNHMAVCPECAAFRYELSVLEDRLPHALAAEYPEHHLSRADLARVMYEHRNRTSRSQWFDRFTTLAQQAAFATAGVALVAALAILAAQFGPRRPASQVQLDPPSQAAAPADHLPLPAGEEPRAPQAEAYNSDMFSIQIQVPQEWRLVQQDTQGEVFSGDDGFVKLATLPMQTGSLDQACAAEAASQPELYGDSPQINRVVVDEFQACLIVGDPVEEDEPGENLQALVANALVIEDTRRDPEDRFWIMAADPENFEMLASSLQILPEEEIVAAAEPPPEPAATAVVAPPELSITAVEVDPEVRVRLSGNRVGLADTECIKSELHVGEQVPEWWPRDNCATMLPEGKWEIEVSLAALNPPASIDSNQQNRFKVYWPGAPEVHQWVYYPQAWAGLTLEEHPLVSAESDSPYTSGFEFIKYISTDILEKHASLRDRSQKESLDELNRSLAPFGYRIEAGERAHSLYRNDDVLSSGITFFSPISLNAAGSNFALGFEDPRGTFLLQKDGVIEWDAEKHLYVWPVYVEDELVSVEHAEDGWESVNVLRSGQIIFTQPIAQTVENPVRALHSLNGQWVLETNETVIIDGEDIRPESGYEEIFHWQPLNGRPFYFFIQDGKVGLSYGGAVLPVQYDQMIRGQCCEVSIFNPSGNDRMVWFYALRDGIWHYVELGLMY
jgi:hypothetical protein